MAPRNRMERNGKLLRFLLLLLADANFELRCLLVTPHFPIKAGGGIFQIRIHVNILRHDSHQSGGFALRAGDPVTLDIGDRHNF